MGFLDNDSYVLGSSYERFTARANVNSQLKSWLKVGTNVGYSKATQNGVQENAGAASILLTWHALGLLSSRFMPMMQKVT